MKNCRVLALAVLTAACARGSEAAEATSCEPPTSRLELFAKARFAPEPEGSASPGVRIDHISVPSFVACLGIRNGDKVVEFEGKPIRNATDVADFLNAFGKQKSLRLVVVDASGKTRSIVNR